MSACIEESPSASGRVRLPGFGLPLQQESIFPTAPEDWYANPITVRERTMIALMATLKDKPDWERKVFDEEIVKKWRAEALQFGKTMTAQESNETAEPVTENEDDAENEKESGNGESMEFDGSDRQKQVSERMFDYCLAELIEVAELMRERGTTAAIDANAIVCMSDSAVTAEVKEKLKAAVASLENVPEAKRDWHPGSDGKVLDLVHPSLCPLIYGRSRILPEGAVPLETCYKYSGRGEIFPGPWAKKFPLYYSKNFQWLPCEVELAQDGKAKIKSYINNLHPLGNEALYSAVEDVIAKSVPLWVPCLLSTTNLPNQDRMEDVGDGYLRDAEFDSDDENNFVLPEPNKYGKRRRGDPSELQEQATKLYNQLRENGMQVIVKLANIHLTPEKPNYNGGSWHIEGQLNEHICASALYYYDEENITPSYLAFREGVDRDVLNDHAEQNREWGFCAVYGIEDHWGDALQVLGKVLTRENRLLAFPNVLQHRVSPFQLEDPSKPGHRKLLALFLVDPYIKIPSTANIPPQQTEWWARSGEMDNVFGKFPNEIADQIIEDIDFPIGNEEAKDIREELIEERREFVDGVTEIFRENGYCFCEH